MATVLEKFCLATAQGSSCIAVVATLSEVDATDPLFSALCLTHGKRFPTAAKRYTKSDSTTFSNADHDAFLLTAVLS